MENNWQNWKRVFLSCHCHIIDRVEAVSLFKNIPIILNNLFFLWICEAWGNILKNRYFAIYYFNQVRIWKLFCTNVAHVTVIIFCTQNFVKQNFVSTELIFSQIPISPPNFAFLTQIRLAIFKNRFLKKMLLKEQKPIILLL